MTVASDNLPDDSVEWVGSNRPHVDRLWRDLAAVASFGAGKHGITRLAHGSALRAANSWLIDQITHAGGRASIDAAASVHGVWGSSEEGQIGVGSHLDTVPCGGRFDGALGVLGGLEAIRRVTVPGLARVRNLRLIAFSDEEGVRFGEGFLGSRVFCGHDISGYATRQDDQGIGAFDAVRAAGGNLERTASAAEVARLNRFVELHIEQGPVLERAGAAIGVVTDVTGLTRYGVEFQGVANHAGTTPMDGRADALAGAARAILELRNRLPSDEATVTVGEIECEPGASNVVPGGCRFSVDLRAHTERARRMCAGFVESVCRSAAKAEALAASVTVLDDVEPVAINPQLVDELVRAADAEGLTWLQMVSGAGHDAMIVASKVPAAIVFVPSRGGMSHSPDEFTSPEACETGVRVLTRLLRDWTS